ncbi:hypothetical protein GCM10018781_02910 [Kitasatospora indigofera]|uniref:Asp23/Gls24 family envelope stress response protein n=1 Tax=Kitasatospora indigofera TaxID=67307 RepID=A0A919KJD3_9ACTN|nr:Asp23/Gls24 family envelope stress response protein [Kitasatospora indigofera]GHH59539.1 hypothetical protein GCM10018781_02910 [Kitasatospora indigofera]
MTPQPVTPRERGATVIPDRVVARIAARAGREALSARPNRPARAAPPAPDASAHVHGSSARIRLAVELPYPTDLAAAARELQRQVAQRVGRLTGLEVTEVALAIRRLLPEGSDGRVGRVV